MSSMCQAKINAKKNAAYGAWKKVYSEVRVTIDHYEQDILKGITEEEQLAAIRIMGEIRNNIIK